MYQVQYRSLDYCIIFMGFGNVLFVFDLDMHLVSILVAGYKCNLLGS